MTRQGPTAPLKRTRSSQNVAAKRGWEARFPNFSGATNINQLAAEARAVGELVVAGGGDGTLSAVAAALVGTDTALGVLPMGTLNHFAKDLGIPLKLEKAVQTLFTGKIARVDVGEVNGRIFLNNSSIGFYPRIVQARKREQRRGRSKWVAFAQAAATVFRKSAAERRVDMALKRGSRAEGYDGYAMSGADAHGLLRFFDRPGERDRIGRRTRHLCGCVATGH